MVIGKGQDRNPEDRQQAIEKLSELREKELGIERSRKTQEEIQGLQEKPIINRMSHMIAERRNQRLRIEDRYGLELKRKASRLNILKQQLEFRQQKADQEMTFSPVINPKSRNMSREKIYNNVGECCLLGSYNV